MSEQSSLASPALGAIDVGSNTIHLVVARPAAGGTDLRYLDDQVELVRLGADVSASGRIGPQRMARAVDTVRQQAERARALGARVILGIATEGVRAAANGAELIVRVRDEVGVTLALVTGEQEAALTYWGAMSGRATLYEGRGAHDTSPDDAGEDESERTNTRGADIGRTAAAGPERRAVVDLGGGSLELVVGEGTAVRWRVSLPLGSGAVHDRYAASDPPTAAELEEARAVAAEQLAGVAPPLPVHRMTACGGTATALAILTSRALLAEREGALVRHLDEGRMAALLEVVRREAADEIAQRYGIEPGRARLLGAGCVVLREAMRRVGADQLEVSARGVREGALLAYVHVGEAWLAAAERGAGW